MCCLLWSMFASLKFVSHKTNRSICLPFPCYWTPIIPAFVCLLFVYLFYFIFPNIFMSLWCINMGIAFTSPVPPNTVTGHWRCSTNSYHGKSLPFGYTHGFFTVDAKDTCEQNDVERQSCSNSRIIWGLWKWRWVALYTIVPLIYSFHIAFKPHESIEGFASHEIKETKINLECKGWKVKVTALESNCCRVQGKIHLFRWSVAAHFLHRVEDWEHLYQSAGSTDSPPSSGTDAETPLQESNNEPRALLQREETEEQKSKQGNRHTLGLGQWSSETLQSSLQFITYFYS